MKYSIHIHSIHIETEIETVFLKSVNVLYITNYINNLLNFIIKYCYFRVLYPTTQAKADREPRYKISELSSGNSAVGDDNTRQSYLLLQFKCRS